jgi:signal transduction histidine kinase
MVCNEVAAALAILLFMHSIHDGHFMTEAEHDVALHGRSFAELQQWVHDLRTPLSIISMGVEALQRVRHDEQQFDELTDMILREGVGPLNSLLDALGSQRDSKES